MQLAKNPRGSHIYCPFNPFITKTEGFRRYKDEIDSGIIEIIGELEEFHIMFSIALLISVALKVWGTSTIPQVLVVLVLIVDFWVVRQLLSISASTLVC